MVCDMKWPWSQTDGLNRWHNYFEMIKSRGGEPGCVNVHWNIKINMRLSRFTGSVTAMPTNFIQNIFSTPRTHTVFPNCDDHVETIGLNIVGAGPYLLV